MSDYDDDQLAAFETHHFVEDADGRYCDECGADNAVDAGKPCGGGS